MGEEDETSVPPYEMTKQELWLQEEEEKYDNYTITRVWRGWFWFRIQDGHWVRGTSLPIPRLNTFCSEKQ